MTIKSQIDYRCPQCQAEWLPFAPGLVCPACGRAVPDDDVTLILKEALESAQFNLRLYGHFDLEYWFGRRLGDRYLKWGFKALDMARSDPAMPARSVAISALMDLDLEEMAPFRDHVLSFMEALVEKYREAVRQSPADWEKMPEPEKPFFGRKTIENE